MKASVADVLRDAVRDRHPNEAFERTLGRVVRKHGGSFDEYMDLIEKVRDRARRDGATLPEAARALAAQP